jgi:hypothetical protein
MGEWRTRTEAWLVSNAAGDEAAAEAALADVFQAMPPPCPSDDFVQRTVAAAWAGRRRDRRLFIPTLTAAAAVLVCAATLGSRGPVDWPLAVIASAGAASILSVAAAMSTVAGWWASAGHTGITLAGVVLMREVIVALFAAGLVGGGASWALQKVLREQPGSHTLGPLCV